MLSASRLFRWFSPGCAAEPLIAFSTVVGMPLCLLRTRLSERPEPVWPKKTQNPPAKSVSGGGFGQDALSFDARLSPPRRQSTETDNKDNTGPGSVGW